ncbi:MAG: alpha/beta fold hydrolase [Candidatus Sericytochromatia bacterium]
MSPLAYQTDSRSGIAYLEAGQGPPLVLLHGNGADARLYEPLIEVLAPHFRVLAPDLPGYGNSPVRERWHMPTYLAELERFVNHKVREPFTLMGHSLGGYLAYQLMIRRRTQAIERAIWMEAAIFQLNRQLTLALPAYGLAHRYQAHSRAKVEGRLRDWCWNYDESDPDFREAFVSSYFRANRDVQGMFMSSAPRLLPYRFRELTMPILCIRGEKQQLVSRQTDWFFPQLPNARKVVIPQAGHFLLFENDAVLQREILDFLVPAPALAV